MSESWTYVDSYRPWTPGNCACGLRAETRCRLCGHESCMRHASHPCDRCYRMVEVICQTPGDAPRPRGMHFERPCGGRLIDGKCEFCDVTTIAGPYV